MDILKRLAKVSMLWLLTAHSTQTVESVALISSGLYMVYKMCWGDLLHATADTIRFVALAAVVLGGEGDPYLRFIYLAPLIFP